MSHKYDLEIHCRDHLKWNIPPGKGALMLFDIVVVKTSKTKIRTTNGKTIAFGDDKITSPPVHARVAIYSNTLATIPSDRKRYVRNELSNLNIDRSTCEYLAEEIVACAVDIINTHAKEMDNGTTVFKLEGRLKVIGEEVIDETCVLGGMKKEVFEGGDGELSCAVCLEEVCGGTECTRTPCSHLFHYGCIVPCLVKSKSCPICRRVLRDDQKEL